MCAEKAAWKIMINIILFLVFAYITALLLNAYCFHQLNTTKNVVSIMLGIWTGWSAVTVIKMAWEKYRAEEDET